MEQSQAKFEGWAMLELFGHQSEVGFVTTQYFGGAAMFQVDIPELPEREYELERPAYVDTGNGSDTWAPKGAKVRRKAVPARTRLISPGAIYALNPCTEETARKAIERNSPRGIILLDIPDEKPVLTAGEPESEDEGCEGWNGDGR